MSFELVVVKNPFDPRERETRHVSATGVPLLTYYDDLAGKMVTVQGRVLRRDEIVSYVPKDNDQIIVRPRVAGAVARIIASIAVMVLAIVIPFLLPASMHLLGALLGAAIGIGGGMIINHFFSPNAASAPSAPSIAAIASGGQQKQETPIYNWGGPQMLAQQGAVITRGYGTMINAGNVIGSYVEIINNHEYMNILISAGEGPCLGITNIRINDQPIQNLGNVWIETRLGRRDQSVIHGFNEIRNEYPQNTRVLSTAQAIVSGTRDDTEALIIEMTFPKGLVKYDDQNNPLPYTVQWAVYIAAVSNGVRGPWTASSSPHDLTDVNNTDHWIAIANEQGEGPSLNILYCYATAAPAGAHYVGEVYNQIDTVQVLNPGPGTFSTGQRRNRGHWAHNPNNPLYKKERAAGDHLRVVKIANWEQSRRFSKGVTRQPYRDTLRIENLVPGKYDVQVVRVTPDDNDPHLAEESWLSAITEIAPFAISYGGLVLVAVRALATNKLSGSNLNITFIQDGGLEVGLRELLAWEGNLVAFYQMHELNGPNAADNSPRGLAGSYGSGCTYGKSGVPNKAWYTSVNFDGTSNAILTFPVLNTGSDFSLEVWIFPAIAQINKLLVGRRSDNAGLILDPQGRLAFVYNNQSFAGDTVVTPNTRHQCAVRVKNGTSVQIILDGKIDGFYDFSHPQNLLLWSSDLTNAAWTINTTQSTAVVRTANQRSPDGTFITTKLHFAKSQTGGFSGVEQQVSGIGGALRGRTFTLSFRAQRQPGQKVSNAIGIRFTCQQTPNNPLADTSDYNAVMYRSVQLSNKMTRYSQTFHCPSTAAHDVIYIMFYSSEAQDVFITDVQLEETPTANQFIKTTATRPAAVGAVSNIGVDAALNSFNGRANYVTICAPAARGGRFRQRWEAGISRINKFEPYSTSNPARIAIDILTNPHYGGRQALYTVDDIDFQRYAERCAELVTNGLGGSVNRHRIDGIFDTQTNVWDALARIGSSSRCSFLRKGTQYGVMLDAPAPVVQMFGMGNIIEGSLNENFAGDIDLATEIAAEFLDRSANYKRTSLTFQLDEDVASGVSNKPTGALDMFGLVDEHSVQREARFHLRGNKKRVRSISFEAWADAVHCVVGDVIAFANDVMKWGESGRIRQGSEDGLQLQLDKTLTLDTANAYQIMTRHDLISFGLATIGAIQDGLLTLIGYAGETATKRLRAANVDLAVLTTGANFVEVEIPTRQVLPNADFSSIDNTWQLSLPATGTLQYTLETNKPNAGTGYSLRLEVLTDVTPSEQALPANVDGVVQIYSVNPGDTVELGFWALREYGSRRCSMTAETFSLNKTHVGWLTSEDLSLSSDIETWEKRVHTFIIPAGVYWIRPYPEVQ